MAFLFGVPERRLFMFLPRTAKRESVKSHRCPGLGHAQTPFFEVLAFKGKNMSSLGSTRRFPLMVLTLRWRCPIGPFRWKDASRLMNEDS